MGGLGMQELIIIMVIALIVFGPRKLPDLGKSLGKAMGQFKRASEDFKRTWEQEVDLEKTRSSIAESSSSHSTSYEGNYHDSSYDPYNSDYGYNAQSDAPSNGEAASTETVPHEAVTEPATATTTAPATATNKPQPGQWI